MHSPYLSRSLLHPSHKLHQPFLIRMGRVAADAGDTGLDVEGLNMYAYQGKLSGNGVVTKNGFLVFA